ncbi:helix-turn-helix transcriptional regulator [Nocardia yamanashiensis]|uniref:helix-turn-helix transcriptional regulator n=1 Tax=Nocardia yamanashiensis TaxID=209247 RepID=UPI00082C6018|nr:WYL domain-containing protein [Nocardia yamanashiensis]
MPDVTRRMLDLLTQLQTGRRWTGEELAARLAVSPRTIRRDVERLRDYGYPVTTRPGPSGFYQLVAGRTLPPLVLDDDEAVATLVALTVLGATTGDQRTDIGVAADRAFGKLDQFLPKRLRPRVSALRETLEAAPEPTPLVDPEALATLALAAAHRELVTFDYTGAAGSTARRRVEPYRQVHLHLRWYLLAWDVERADWRTFRLDRISGIQSTAASFTPRPLPDRSAADYLRAELTAPRHRAVLTVAAPAALVADRLKFQDCEIEPLEGGRCRILTHVDSFEWLVLNIAFLDADFHIDEPPQFRTRARELGERLLRAGLPSR